MNSEASLLPFIEAAKTQGASDSFLVELCKEKGWPPEKTLGALALYYERATGITIPAHVRSEASAKDAFLYLLAFATLGTWAISLGSLLFTLIDKWIPDPAFPNRYFNADETIASSLAAILVAFPIYLFVMNLVIRGTEQHPEKLESGVRKWLTYIALLIAAGVLIGDLVTFLTFLLRGELSGRFEAKVAAVLLISGGVFWYYLVSLKGQAAEVRDALA